MRNSILCTVASMLLAGVTHTVLADNSSSSDDRDNHIGSQFVWVTAITGNNEAGEETVLFSNWQGALLPLAQLSQADRLIKSQGSAPQGTYNSISMQLANKLLTVNATGMQQQALPKNLSTKIYLRGQLEVSASKVVDNNNNILSASPGPRLALLQK